MPKSKKRATSEKSTQALQGAAKVPGKLPVQHGPASHRSGVPPAKLGKR